MWLRINRCLSLLLKSQKAEVDTPFTSPGGREKERRRKPLLRLLSKNALTTRRNTFQNENVAEKCRNLAVCRPGFYGDRYITHLPKPQTVRNAPIMPDS